MGYSDEELNTSSNSSEEDISIWNAGSVYYDDEVVSYQGKYYKALRKTSAEIPGRSKAGTWKELDSSYFSNVTEEEDLYDDDIVETPAETKTKSAKEPVRSKEEENTSVKPVNKPILHKKTLKEQQEELKLRKEKIVQSSPVTEQKTAQTDKVPPSQPSVERKMMEAPNDQQIVNEILKEISFEKIKGTNSDDNSITSNLVLPTTAKEASILHWESSHPDVISPSGEVKRPDDGHDIEVNLSVKVSKEKASATRFFTVWVKAAEKQYTDAECVDIILKALSFKHIKGQNIESDSVSHNLELLTHGLHGTKIFWASSKREVLDEGGRLYKDRFTGSTKVSLYAVIVKNQEKRLKSFDLILV